MREYHGTFGSFLAMKRKEIDMTSKDVAARLKISPAYYSSFEIGLRNAPEQEMQDRMADILELTHDERLLLYDLAGKTRGIVAADLPEYIIANPYVRVALRTARDSKASQAEWLEFIAKFENRKEVDR